MAAQKKSEQKFFERKPLLVKAGDIILTVIRCVNNVYKIIGGCREKLYNIGKAEMMKRKDLIKKLLSAGFVFRNHGGNHEKRGFIL